MMQNYFVRTRGLILGPFSKEELLAQIQRGSISRMHEVSLDKHSWCQAGEVPDLFPPRPRSDQPRVIGVPQPSTQRPSAQPQLGPQNPSLSVSSPADQQQWHYHAHGQNQGPVGTGELAGLFSSGQLPPHTMVWRQGWPQWMPANQVTEFQGYLPPAAASAGVPSWAIVGGWMAAGVLVIVLAVLSFWAATPDAPLAAVTSTGSARTGETISGVSTVNEQKQLKEAVGKVLFAWKVTTSEDRNYYPLSAGIPLLPEELNNGFVEEVKNKLVALNEKIGLAKLGDGRTIVVERSGSRSVKFHEVVSGNTGSCFTVNDRGYLMTNQHVVSKYQEMSNLAETQLDDAWPLGSSDSIQGSVTKVEPGIWVFIGNTYYRADLVYVDDEFDFAVLKIDRQGSPYFSLSASSENLALGTDVVALGFPGAAEDNFHKDQIKNNWVNSVDELYSLSDLDYVFTRGVVSRIPQFDAPDEMIQHKIVSFNGEFIQHTAEISGGNSGGPLVNLQGVVQGINTWVHLKAEGIQYSLTFAQIRKKVDRYVPDVEWE